MEIPFEDQERHFPRTKNIKESNEQIFGYNEFPIIGLCAPFHADIFIFGRMKVVQIEPTSRSPLIDFRSSTGSLEIRGRCILEDASTFFGELLEAMDSYISSPLT